MQGAQANRMSFRVVFTGSLREGFTRRRGIEALHKQFSLGFDQVKYLLSGSNRVVKSVRDRNQAERIVRALWNGGWHSELHQEGRVIFRSTAGDSATASADGDASQAEMPRHYSVDSSVSVCLPTSWQALSDLNSNAVLQAGDREKHQYIVVLKQSREGLPPALTLLDYSAAQLEQCITRVNGGELLSSPAPVVHGELSACAAEMSAQLNGVLIHYLVVIFLSQRDFYSVFIWCDQKTFDQQRSLFNRVLVSFRVDGSLQ